MIRVIHRANTGMYPENTLESIKAAASANADAVEIDVRMTADNIPVIWHDNKLSRLSRAKGCIEDHTLSELKKLNIVDRDLSESGTLATLEEAVTALKGKKSIILDIKCSDNDENANLILAVVKGLDPASELIISSFDEKFMRRFKAVNPDLRVGYIYADTLGRFKPKDKHLAEEFYSHHVMHSMLGEESVTNLHENGLNVYAWTANDIKSIKKMIDLEIEGIITDEINLLNRVLAGGK